jgi:hypothetical protein
LKLRDERRGARAFLHEVRASRDEGSWNVTDLHQPNSRSVF